MACSRYLGFDPVERPQWRNAQPNNDSIPNVSTMIAQILEYKRAWLKLRKRKKERYETVQQEMYLEFLYQIQVGEDIGILHRRTFDEIVNDESAKMTPKRGLKRQHSNSGKDNQSRYKCKKSDSINSLEDRMEKYTLSSSQTSNNSTYDDTMNGGSLSSNENSLPSSQDAQIFIMNSQNDQTKATETINLLRGYHHLKNELQKIPKEERPGYVGLIDVETCIKSCHEILMCNLIDKMKTPAGKFSVLPRTAEFEGKQYFYPSYKTEDVAFEALQAVVDQYNTMISEVSKIDDEKEKLKNSFKCASVLLFSFLTLHPFSDGNGRLARLLCNHCLKTFCPFPTAVYNNVSPTTRSDYLRALINCREGLNLSPYQIQFPDDSIREALSILEQKPVELCSLIIESNWFTWRYFLRKLGIHIPFILDFEVAE
ncbi:unnamed protein product [Mytilus edulis]|uniref:Fido domain-containing protein n=1 Tax=Mytilus edulis TaxID=6550 RepID=A0A8S3TDP5_MYTED|nr:unnamed protein product [Mytilus edulis]